jgi:hypothetical protein
MKLQSNNDTISCFDDLKKAIVAKNKLAMKLFEEGDAKTALEVSLENIEDVMRQKLDDDIKLVFETIYNIVGFSLGARDFKRSITVGNLILESQNKVLKMGHELEIGLMNNMIAAYMGIGDIENAMSIGKDALPQAVSWFGPNHGITKSLFKDVYRAFEEGGCAHELVGIKELIEGTKHFDA